MGATSYVSNKQASVSEGRTESRLIEDIKGEHARRGYEKRCNTKRIAGAIPDIHKRQLSRCS